jgi:cytochrome c biogenesis protein CcdA
MAFGGVALAFLAGVLSVLSPCVLPLLPIVLGAAISEHRMGPAALAAGLTLSFAAIGLFVATLGYSIGLDADVFRLFGAALFIVIGLVLAAPTLQARFILFAAPLSGWTETRFGGFNTAGLKGQFALGLLLGAVWSPCVGPTLGAASVLAAQGKDLGQVAAVMAAFGVGAATPLLLLGLISREALMGWRKRLLEGARRGKMLLGVVLLALGVLIATGLDRRMETMLVDASPAWLSELTSRY